MSEHAQPQRAAPHVRADYSRLLPMTTRLRDIDVYGHMNNVVYNEYFDTAVNQTLVELGVLDLEKSDVIGLVVHSQTSYFRPVSFPDRVVLGLRVGRLGRTSVTYEFALFRGDDDSAAAQGSYTHAYVDRASSRPVELPPALRRALEPLVRASA
ncbi:acyl-CoA thioesterase [Achromobacter kerstersii]|jgi:acyl-CoA thioester hydrolase|uniref:acyl-CoA thioesterase n=1 Tax=Achromobacter kerstersii TaxID=1353890 RepID=UPI003D050E9B